MLCLSLGPKSPSLVMQSKEKYLYWAFSGVTFHVNIQQNRISFEIYKLTSSDLQAHSAKPTSPLSLNAPVARSLIPGPTLDYMCAVSDETDGRQVDYCSVNCCRFVQRRRNVKLHLANDGARKMSSNLLWACHQAIRA